MKTASVNSKERLYTCLLGIGLFLICLSLFFRHTRGLLWSGYLFFFLGFVLKIDYFLGDLRRDRSYLVLFLFLLSLIPSILYSPFPWVSLEAYGLNYFFPAILAVSVSLLGFEGLFRRGLLKPLALLMFLPNALYLLYFAKIMWSHCQASLGCWLVQALPLGANPNYWYQGLVNLSSSLMFFGVLGLGLFFLFRRDSLCWFFLGIAFLDILVLFLLGRRAALMGVSVGAFVSALIFSYWRRYFLGLAIILFSAILVILITPYGRTLFIRSERIEILLSGDYKKFKEAGSLGLRLYAWPKYAKVLSRSLLKGTGLGRKVQKKVLSKEVQETRVAHAHNTFLNIALQAGLIPCILFFIFYGLLFQKILSRSFSVSPDISPLKIALFSFLVAFLVASFFEGLERHTKFIPFWLGAGFVLAINKPTDMEV